MNTAQVKTADNVITLTVEPRPPRPSVGYRQPFKIQPFTNPRTGSQSWRVTGSKRDGTRVRENYAGQKAAECRQVDLTMDHLARETETAVRATKLTDTQLKLAEAAFMRLDADEEIMLAVDHWKTYGKQNAVAESPRLDDAVAQFQTWLQSTETLRPKTKDNLRYRVAMFGNGMGNHRVADIVTEAVESYLDKRGASAASKNNDRRALSRFFSWCKERPRRWTKTNPCHDIKIHQVEKAPPSVLSVADCRELLRQAESYKCGKLAPYFALCLFGGLRPYEVRRLTPEAVNLTDGEIRLEGAMTKTKRPRVVAVCKTLRAWLARYEGTRFFPASWRKDFQRVINGAGFGTPTKAMPDLKPWVEDCLRHTAISHYFRNTGSYGQTAEQFGNSEAIIKRHYQGRVNSEDTKQFYALQPTKKGTTR
jgi:integrase